MAFRLPAPNLSDGPESCHANPPQRMTASIAANEPDIWSLRISPQASKSENHGLVLIIMRVINDLAAEVIEPGGNVKQVFQCFLDLLLLFGPHKKEYEAAAACA